MPHGSQARMHQPPLQLLLLTVFLLTVKSNSAATTASAVHVWAVVNLTECNATCPQGKNASATDGVQRVNLGCYAATSASLVRVAGTRLFLATSADDQLPNVFCAEAASTDAPAFIRCHRTPDVGCRSDPSVFSWQLDTHAAVVATCQQLASDAAVATSCGQSGSVALEMRCKGRRNSLQPATVVVDDFRCLDAGWPRPESLTSPCRQLLGCRPVWKAGHWGACSRNCGLGEMARTVECSRLIDSPTEGPVYVPAPDSCPEGETRPHSRDYCVVQHECPPYYRLRPGKCIPTVSGAAARSRRWCNETGLRPTNAECVQLVGDVAAGLNQTRHRPSNECRGLVRPPLFQSCRVDEETLAQRGIACVEPSDVALAAPPRLLPEPPGTLLVQMERLPEMGARCGQSVTLIPGTRLRLHCGVANYKADDLRWRKLGRKRDFRSTGGLAEGEAGTEEVCKRICVSNGDLVFRRFRPRDSGTYEVTAGTAKATVRLSWHTAYAAFLGAYLPRAHLLRRLPSSTSGSGSPLLARESATSLWGGADGWAAEQPATMLARDALAWMTGPWGDCPCAGAERQRQRAVRCERLRSGAYLVVADSQCARLLGPAPPAAEACERKCPHWRLGDWDGECPASRCYTTEVSLELRSVTCSDGSGNNATLPESACRATGEPKPEAARQCRNAACQPEWSAGLWSACSASCGAFGFRSRNVQCLWRGTGQPAGLACEHLAMPKGYKSCYEGPCHILGCVDLSPVCKIYQASALCAHPSLRKSCCATCNTYQLEVYRSLKRT